MERVCAAGAPNDNGRFHCISCLTRRKDRVWTASCPGCGVETEKVYGFDHITCPCGTHWWYLCGEESTELLIYKHIADAHDGISYGVDYEHGYDYDSADEILELWLR